MAEGNYFKDGLEWRADGSLARTPPYTPEEQAVIDRWRREMRLRMAREAFEKARDRYLSLKLEYLEHERETVTVN
jgi:hypothetical protein